MITYIIICLYHFLISNIKNINYKIIIMRNEYIEDTLVYLI
uniref:Uncharacterized protein n=1 Tax=viral metagenome TaxID=1070528 RepID=A0A6C0KAV3_9ZZZZ